MLSHLIKSAMFPWDHAALSLQFSAFMCTIYCCYSCTGEHFDLITFVCYTNHVLNLACLNVAFQTSQIQPFEFVQNLEETQSLHFKCLQAHFTLHFSACLCSLLKHYPM